MDQGWAAMLNGHASAAMVSASAVNASVEEEIDQHQQDAGNAKQPCQKVFAHDELL